MEEMPKLVWEAADFDEHLNWNIPIAPSPPDDWVSVFHSVLNSRAEEVTGEQWGLVSVRPSQHPGGDHEVHVQGVQDNSDQMLKETLNRYVEQANHQYGERQARAERESQRRDEEAREKKSAAEEMRRRLRDN